MKFPGEPWASKLFLLTALAASPFCLRLQTFRRLGQLILHDITVLRLGCKWWIWPQPQIHVSVWDKRHQQEVFPPKGIEHNSLLCEWTIDIWNIFRGPTAFCRSPCGQFCSSELGKMHPASIQWSPDRCQFCSSSQLVGMLASAIVRYSGEIKKSPAHLLVFSKPFVPTCLCPKIGDSYPKKPMIPMMVCPSNYSYGSVNIRTARKFLHWSKSIHGLSLHLLLFVKQ